MVYMNCVMFQYLLHVNALDDKSMVIVERPPLAIDEALPPNFTKKLFGT